ncbi:MAG TPA: flagellar hook-associated protein FlgK [Gallionellaceae bacterium]|nr:flagellar hook-associated protein FlgK [Gallionellaceae bacterium]
MGVGIFSTSVSALTANQVGLATTQHNIANANTPGFNRQEVDFVTRQAQVSGTGFIGQGVDVSTVKRVYSEFLGNQLLQEQSVSSQLTTYYAQMQQINNMLADPTSGLSPAVQDFFSSVNNVSNNPESVPSRQSLLSGAGLLTSRFQSINQRLSELTEGANKQIGYTVTQINSYAKQLAALNTNIILAQSANGQPPNDLMDQRDQLLTLLNQEVKATVVKQDNGSFSVFIGSGQPLVMGDQTLTMSTQYSPTDPSKLDIVFNYSNGVVATIQQSSLQGGNLGGLLSFRDKALTDTQNALGRVAMAVAGTFNQQHQMGQDLNGALGGNFFIQAVPQVYSSTANVGTAAISASVVAATDYSALTGSDYRLKFNGGTSYTLTRLSDNLVTNYPAGLPAAPVDGLTLTTTAGAVAGDTFMIRPTVNGARDIAAAISDPAKIAAASPVRSNATLSNLGTGKISAVTVNLPPPVTPNPAHPLTDLNLQQPITITFNNPPTTYNIAGVGVGLPAAGLPYTAGTNISYNGWTMQITGSPSATDTFTIGPNTGATADGSNMLLLASLQTQTTMAGGTTSYQGAYSQLVSSVGNKTRELEVTSNAQSSMVEQSIQTIKSFSGVNLDEEAANLLRYQRAYQAAGKALQVANVMFDTILELGK